MNLVKNRTIVRTPIKLKSTKPFRQQRLSKKYTNAIKDHVILILLICQNVKLNNDAFEVILVRYGPIFIKIKCVRRVIDE